MIQPMFKTFIRAATTDPAKGLFIGAMICIAISIATKALPLGVIGACLAIGGVFSALRNTVDLSDDDDSGSPKKLDDHLLKLRSLSARATAMREPQIGREIDAMAALYRRLDSVKKSGRPELLAKIDQIYAASTDSIRRAVELAEVQQQITTPDVRARIHITRQELVGDIGKSMRLLERTVDELQAAAISPSVSASGSAEALNGLREELDQSLAVSARVEQRMRELEDDGSREFLNESR